MRKIEIEFERGGLFTAELLEKDAPKTCEGIWKRLPLEFEVCHTISSGRGIFGYVDFRLDPENQRAAGLTPGTLIYEPSDPARNLPNEILISYGLFVLRMTAALNFLPGNVFAEIRENLEELTKVGQRIHRQGAEKIFIRKKEV